MNETGVRGRLHIGSATLDTDLKLIQDHVSAVSEPRPTQTIKTGEVRFWQVEFAATTAQWRALAPMLRQRGIRATLYEEAHLANFVEKWEEARIRRQDRFNFAVLVGTVIILAGLAGFWFLRATWFFLLIAGLGVVVMAIAATRLLMEEEKAGE